MVEENSIAYIDVTESTITKEKLNSDVHMSIFVNEKCYMCISNLGANTQTIAFNDEWINRETKQKTSLITLKAGELMFLERVITNE